MLYDQWRKMAKANAGQFALSDLAIDRAWTFAELFQEGEDFEPDQENVQFPAGRSSQFIVHLLAAWRLGRIVCPLEQPNVRERETGILPVNPSIGGLDL